MTIRCLTHLPELAWIATRLACAFVLAFGVAACSDTFHDVHISREERAIATAEEIVAEVTQFYADERWDGEVRTFAIDQESLNGFSDLLLEDGLRHVAEQLRSERALWSLRFSPSDFRIDDSPATLFVDVIDLHVDHCCHTVAVGLVRDEDGWQIAEVWAGGAVEETKEFRRERLAKGAEIGR